LLSTKNPLKPMMEIKIPRYYVRHHEREFSFPLDTKPETLDDLILMGLQRILSSPPEKNAATKWWMLFTERKTAIETIEMAKQLQRGTTIVLVEKKDVLVDWSELSYE
jgi:hypothetical protein